MYYYSNASAKTFPSPQSSYLLILYVRRVMEAELRVFCCVLLFGRGLRDLVAFRDVCPGLLHTGGSTDHSGVHLGGSWEPALPTRVLLWCFLVGALLLEPSVPSWLTWT